MYSKYYKLCKLIKYFQPAYILVHNIKLEANLGIFKTSSACIYEYILLISKIKFDRLLS